MKLYDWIKDKALPQVAFYTAFKTLVVMATLAALFVVGKVAVPTQQLIAAQNAPPVAAKPEAAAPAPAAGVKPSAEWTAKYGLHLIQLEQIASIKRNTPGYQKLEQEYLVAKQKAGLDKLENDHLVVVSELNSGIVKECLAANLSGCQYDQTKHEFSKPTPVPTPAPTPVPAPQQG